MPPEIREAAAATVGRLIVAAAPDA
jgi:hypothetical protein